MPTYVIYYSQGNSNGPFDLYLSGSSGLNLYASNIAIWQLQNGYTVTFPDGIPSSSIDIFDVAYGCFTDQNVPFPSPSPSVTPTISISPTRTPTISVSPTITPSVSLTPTVTPSFTPPPTTTPSITITPTITVTPGNSPSPTRTPSVTRTPPASVPPNFLPLVSTFGYAQSYQACYAFNTQAPGLGTVYVVDPPGAVVGATVYQLSAFGVYTPLVGGNLWYVISPWITYGLPGSAYQVDNSGVITNIIVWACFTI